MNDLWEELRRTPGRYQAIAGVSALVLFLGTWIDAARVVPFGFVGPVGQALPLLGACLLALAPLLALVRPGAALALAGLSLVTLLQGTLLFAGFGAILIVCVLGSWRSRQVPWMAALTAYLAMAWSIYDGVNLVFPGATRNTKAGIFALTMRWTYPSDSAMFGYLAVWLVAVLIVLGAAYWLRWSVAAGARIERAGDVEEQSAVTAERARLARDLHDVVAHHVSLIAVRAETAPYTQPNLGEEARAVLHEIAGDARLALDELRGVLGILNRSGAGGDRSPQPGLAEVPALVERTRSAGTEVRLNGDPGVSVPPSVGYVAYRVVQEALTNARRHAPGSAVDLTLDASAGMLVVAVANPLGAGGAPGSGHGLAGMRERVEALGGHLEVGTQAGWFVVRATLPRRDR